MNLIEFRFQLFLNLNSGIPGIIGCIDGTGFQIPRLKNQPDINSYYSGRKKIHVLHMQAVCDHRKIFTDVLIGWPGSVHDSRVLRHSDIYVKGLNQYAVSVFNSILN